MKILKLLAFTIPVFAFSQTRPLESNFKVEAGFQGFNAGYELPVSQKLLVDLNAGVGGAVHIYSSDFNTTTISYIIAENNEIYPSPFGCPVALLSEPRKKSGARFFACQ